MWCWTCDSFLIRQTSLLCYHKLFSADNLKLTFNPIRLALDFLSFLLLLLSGRSWFPDFSLHSLPAKPADHRILLKASFTLLCWFRFCVFRDLLLTSCFCPDEIMWIMAVSGLVSKQLGLKARNSTRWNEVFLSLHPEGFVLLGSCMAWGPLCLHVGGPVVSAMTQSSCSSLCLLCPH